MSKNADDTHKRIMTIIHNIQENINESEWSLRDMRIRHQRSGHRSKNMISKEEILEHYINDKTKFEDGFAWLPKRCLISGRWMWLKSYQKLIHFKSYVYRDDYDGTYGMADRQEVLAVHPHELLAHKLRK